MRLRTKVIAAEVANLTDARYFAAWGVDYISYAIDEDSPNYIGEEGIKEIIDWIEGSVNLGHITSVDGAGNIGQRLINLNMSGVIIDAFVDIDKSIYDVTQKVYKTCLWEKDILRSEEELIILKLENSKIIETDTMDLAKLCESNEVYIDGVSDVKHLETLISKIKPAGIVVRGGEEEKVGFKSYDELDEIFEYLEED